MSVFSRIGDFFRTPFESDEETKRRKERERQEAEARRQAANQARLKTVTQPQQQQAPIDWAKMHGNKQTDSEKVVQKLQQERAAAAKPPPAPNAKPQVVAQSIDAGKDYDFKTIKTVGEENKKILGWNAAAILPKQFEKRDKVKVEGTYKTNKDIFVSQFDKMDEERKKIYLDQITKQAQEGDQAAYNSLKALTDANRAVIPRDALQRGADFASVPGRSIMRVGTGIVQGGSGLVDLATPGEGTSRTSKFFDEVAKNQDKSAKEAEVETAYKVGNVAGEIASYFIPGTLAAKAAAKLPRGTKITASIVDNLASKVDNAGDANKLRTFLADRMRKGWTVDQAIEEMLISGKYIGENASKGNDTSAQSVMTDVATGVGGSLLFPARAAKRLNDLDANPIEDMFGAGLAATGEAAESRLTRNADDILERTDDAIGQAEAAAQEKGLRNISEEELRVLADDPNTIALERKRARDELLRRAEAAEQAAFDADPLNKPAFQVKQEADNIVRAVETRLNDYLNANPQLSRQQVEAAVAAARQKANDLVEALKESRYSALRAVDEQAAQADETIKAGQEAVGEAQAARAATTSPNPATVVEDVPATGSPEVEANNAYRPSTEEVLYGDTPTFEDPQRLSMWQRFSPDRIIRENITRPLENSVNRGINALQTANNAPARALGRFFTGFSREAGVDAASQTARMQLRGGIETGKVNREAIADLTKGVAEESRERIWATLDPEFAARRGMEVPQLDEAEAVIQQKLKTIIDNTTAENLRRGLITPEQAASQSYIKRAYSVYDGATDAPEFERSFRQELMNQYKGRKEVSDEMVDLAITDPTYLVGKKTAESESIWAMQDYGNFLAESGTVVDQARPGYTQLPDSPVFGNAAGKYVPRNVAEDFTGFQYNNAMVSAFNDLITAYDRLGIRQAKKQLLTVFNPAVQLGNRVTNQGIFAQLSGVNPLQFNVVYSQVDNMMKQNHQLYREAVQQGLTGIDITQADFYAQRIAQSTGDVNMAKKAIQWFQKGYSGADDKARITSYVINRQRGYSPEEAARMTQRGFQDYKSVGFFYDIAAKTPVLGNAFVRFAADSVRIAKNAAVDHPLRSIATVALWNTFTKAMSVASGETDEERKEREGRFGAPKIPFTDIPLSVQTPWGEVNVARFAPWYSLNEISSTEASKFLPFANSPVERDENGNWRINAAGMQDPLLGQVVQLGVDRDFRGKSIQDPDGNPDRPDQFREDPLSGEDKKNNVLRFLFNNNAPMGREIDSIKSAMAGEEDIYGKDRSVPQAIARAFGFKVEEYGDKQREKNRSMKEYQDELATIEKELEGLSPTAQEAYKRLSGYYKMREEVDNEFSPGDKRKKKAAVYEFSEDKWKDYAANPELYDLMVDKKQREKAKDGKPIQPEFDPRLSDAFRRQLIQNKMVAPGDDAELDQRMYSSPEFDYYQQLRDQYKEDAKKYFPESNNDEQFVDELVKHQDAKFPTKPDILKQYGAAYKLYTDGKAAKPEFTDALKAAKEQYNRQTLDWTNNERKARGLPAITWEMWNNPTFGYDETPSGFGFGFGNGKKEPYGNLFGELTNFTGQVDRLKPIEAQGAPDLSRFFTGLTAGSNPGRRKPTVGASARGQ